MEADLNNNFEYDKTIIYINSKNGIFDPSSFKFYIKFDEKIKNPIAIKIIDATIISNLSTFNVGDEFYITLNDIDRSTTYIKDSNNNINICKYFEMIPFADEPYGTKFISTLSRGTGTTNWSDSGVHILNPVLPTLDRFSIEIKDKNFSAIPVADLDSLKLNICVYTLKKQIL